jgi:hypothetical protein
MASSEKKLLVVRVNGVDISRVVESVTIQESGPDRVVSIELTPELRSQTGDAHRHLNGLKKAKS